jgi:hypothetical protein
MDVVFVSIISHFLAGSGSAPLPEKDVTATPPPIEQQATTESTQSSEDWDDSILNSY